MLWQAKKLLRLSKYILKIYQKRTDIWPGLPKPRQRCMPNFLFSEPNT